MVEIYGHRFTSGYGDDPNGSAAATWAKGLAGITPHQIAAGLRACAIGTATIDGWPPTLPEFRALCLGIPSMADVRSEITRRGNTDRTAFARLVWQFLDGYRFGRADQREADRLLSNAYLSARAHVLEGKPMPETPVAVITASEPEPIRPADPEHVSRALAEMAEKLGLGPGETEHLDPELVR